MAPWFLARCSPGEKNMNCEYVSPGRLLVGVLSAAVVAVHRCMVAAAALVEVLFVAIARDASARFVHNWRLRLATPTGDSD